MFRRFVFASLTASPTPPFITTLRHREGEALDLRAGDRRRQRQRERIGHQVDERRTVDARTPPRRAPAIAVGFSTRDREMPSAFATAA